MRRSKPLNRFLFEEVDLPLECVVLSIGGMALIVTGSLLFWFSAEKLAADEDGFLGLLLVIFALQTIALGKTPFGDMRRSRTLLSCGVAIASVGIAACFIPGLFAALPRLLVSVCFALGGALQLVRTFLDETKMRAWLRYGGLFRQLWWACASVYALSLLTGLLLWTAQPGPVTATTMVLFGLAVVYLGGLLRLIYRDHPEAQRPDDGAPVLSFDRCMLLLTGVFMILLGTLLIPVNLGLLAFAENAQLGLLMIIFAIQMLASANTPIGQYPHRSWLMIGGGVLFSMLGIISCVIPQVLVGALTLLVGVLNIVGGLAPLVKRRFERTPPGRASAAHPLLRNLSRTQLAMHLLSITFGASMLFPGIIPGLVIGVVLAANGGMLLHLLRLLIALAALGDGAAKAAGESHRPQGRPEYLS